MVAGWYGGRKKASKSHAFNEFSVTKKKERKLDKIIVAPFVFVTLCNST